MVAAASFVGGCVVAVSGVSLFARPLPPSFLVLFFAASWVTLHPVSLDPASSFEFSFVSDIVAIFVGMT